MRRNEGVQRTESIIIRSFSPVTDDTGIRQQLKDPEELESQQISSLSTFFILTDTLLEQLFYYKNFQEFL